MKTPDFENNENNENNEPNSWQKAQLDKSILEHENGSTNYIPWEQAKKDLFKKFNFE
jgi:hypothetical protein